MSDRFRAKRDVQLKSLIDTIHAERGTVNVLDMGGTVEYWRRVGFDYLRRRGVRITLLNLHATELGDGPPDLFEMAVGDACDLRQFADHSFDLTHSNSVIEHVRTWDAMRAFARETRRVGRHYYLQTPNYWFPIDPHYYRFPMFHWLPRPTRAAMFRRLPIAHVGKVECWDKAYEMTDASRLLSRRQLEVLMPGARIEAERMAGLAKSFVCTTRTPASSVGSRHQ